MKIFYSGNAECGRSYTSATTRQCNAAALDLDCLFFFCLFFKYIFSGFYFLFYINVILATKDAFKMHHVQEMVMQISSLLNTLLTVILCSLSLSSELHF